MHYVYNSSVCIYVNTMEYFALNNNNNNNNCLKSNIQCT